MVGIVTKLQAGQPRNRSMIPNNSKRFFLLWSIQTSSGNLPSSCLLGTAALSQGVHGQKFQDDHSLAPSAEVKNKCSYTALTHLHTFMACAANFTYTFYKKWTCITTQCETTNEKI